MIIHGNNYHKNKDDMFYLHNIINYVASLLRIATIAN